MILLLPDFLASGLSDFLVSGPNNQLKTDHCRFHLIFDEN
jgi:hypothetical protein